MRARELRAQRSLPPLRRTYLCLEGSRRKPTDYEITTTALCYYPALGFELETPVTRHYRQHQSGTLLALSRWDDFEDPAHTTYRAYVAERRDQEAFLDRLLERPNDPPPRALTPLLGLISALRFALHGLQMSAAYVGALAPAGRISVAAALQAADELRAIQRLCQWLCRSGKRAAEIDALGRELWQQGPALQPLRRLIEQLLVTYDWDRALVALNGVIKPVFDRLWFDQLAVVAERYRDEVLEKILTSLSDDARWHETWFASLAELALAQRPEGRTALERGVAELRPHVAQAAQALMAGSEALLGDEGSRAYLWRELDAALEQQLGRIGLGARQQEEVLHAARS